MSLRMVIPVVLTQDVRHLILKVLCGDQWIQELPATLDHGVDFTTATAEMRIVVERLPKVVNRFVPRLGASINQDTTFGLWNMRKDFSMSGKGAR